jgi:hypothetical protein
MNKDNWEEVNGRLIRTFYFKKPNTFSNKVKDMALNYGLTPKIVLNKDYIKISVSENGKCTIKCHLFAEAIDKL